MDEEEYLSRMQKAVEKASIAIKKLKDENSSLKERLAVAEIEIGKLRAAALSKSQDTHVESLSPYPSSKSSSGRARRGVNTVMHSEVPQRIPAKWTGIDGFLMSDTDKIFSNEDNFPVVDSTSPSSSHKRAYYRDVHANALSSQSELNEHVKESHSLGLGESVDYDDKKDRVTQQNGSERSNAIHVDEVEGDKEEILENLFGSDDSEDEVETEDHRASIPNKKDIY